jgi:hypothetical protein
MNAQFIQLAGDLQLVFHGERNARLLCPIPQSGIVKLNFLHPIHLTLSYGKIIASHITAAA